MSDTQVPDLTIAPVDAASLSRFWALVEKFGFQEDREYYERCLERQALNELILYLFAYTDSDTGKVADAGFCILNWEPKYAYFKKSGLAEIQDLNVLREFRRRGIARQVITFCEDCVKEKGMDEIGIGVGLDARFGPAQRLYVKMGYIPDGTGASYDRKQVGTGEFRPIDENLCLMMTKTLI